MNERPKTSAWRRLAMALVMLASVNPVQVTAQLFTGTNQPGTGSYFEFSVPAGSTNFSLTVSNLVQAFSYLYVKVGDGAAPTNYDYASRLDWVNNSVNLEMPELVTQTNYSCWVQTPLKSGLHVYSVVLKTNRADARQYSMPMAKPVEFTASGALSAAMTHYFQIDIPTNLVGWRLVLSSIGTADPDIYIQREGLPTATSYIKSSVNRPIDTLLLSNTETTNGTYFVLVTIPFGEPGNATYTLRTELGETQPLAWDPGTSPVPSNAFTNTSSVGGDYVFKITAQNAASSIWRTRLDVQSGEADLYLRQGNPPTSSLSDYRSTYLGSDGVALVQNAQFLAGQIWYVMVTAMPGSQWSLYSGNLLVQQLASPAADDSGITNTVIAPEGINFYRTTINSNTIAWHLGLGGLTNSLYVRKGAVAHGFSGSYYDWKEPGQTLLVPPYLVQNLDYYVTVMGTPGQAFTLDSRQQPIVELPFVGSASTTATDYGYLTFHVTVPAQQIGWQLDLGMPSGDASLAVRLAGVANQYVNTAYVEKTNSSFKTLTVVPPTLIDGSYYVTVYGTPPFTAALTNVQPRITDVPYAFVVTNDAPERVGWRFYRVTDINEQLVSLGWDLLLSGQVPATEIILRRNALPGRWSSRNNILQGTSSTVTTRADLSSLKGFLQAPRHAADIWYIGINQTNQPLGPFVLTSRESSRQLVNLGSNFSTNTIVNQPAGLVEFFLLDVPAPALGLELKLSNVTSGDPRIVVCRDLLPVDLSTILVNSNFWSPNTATAWPSGAQAAYATDWTGYTLDSRGTNDSGHYFFASQGNPLEPGRYFAGVMSGGASSSPMSYDLLARLVLGDGSLGDLAAGASVSRTGAAPHELFWNTVTISTNSPSWKLRLNMDAGDGLMVVRQGGLPNYGAALPVSPVNLGGTKLQKLGNEHLLMMPSPPASNIVAGTYYVGVVSEGQRPAAPRSGSNTCSFTLKSEGPIVPNDLGTVDPLAQTNLVSDQAQDGGETHLFRFTVLTNTGVIEVRLRNRSGNPRMTLRADAQLPSLSDGYGYSGGWPPAWADDKLIRIPTPAAGQYTLMVQAANVAGVYSNATYRVEVSAQAPQPLAFDNGAVTVTNQPLDAWAYYQVNVPAGILGWDVRLANVTSGDPRLAICRDLIPFNQTTRTLYGSSWNPFAATNWPSGWEIVSTTDWTGYPYSASGINEAGRFFNVAMGNPLEPGNYIIGIASGGIPGTATNLSYRLESRGVGTNLSIPVVPLAWAGGQTNITGLAPRDASFFSVQIPTNMPSWQVRLGLLRGEGMLVLRKDGLPNFGAALTTSVTNLAGCRLQKQGNEQFALLAGPNSLDIPAGTYYLAAISEGVGPSPTAGRIGSNNCDLVLQSIGMVPLHSAGTIDRVTGYQQDIVQEGGSVLAYQFNVTTGTVGVVIRLDNRTNNPAMTVRAGPILPRSLDNYGREGGRIEDASSPTRIQLHTLAGGSYSVLIQAGNVAGLYPDAKYTLRILPMESYITPLNFDGGQVDESSQLAVEWQYFSVDVPTNALGWDLRLMNITAGSPRLVICRSDWPVDLNSRLADGTFWSWGAANNWPVSAQAAPGLDWTGYRYSPAGADMTGTIFVAGMGNPVEPGHYIVGVSSVAGTTSPMSYTIASRGIGAGFTIPVTPLGTGNVSTTRTGLNPREAAYYSISVPVNAPLWKLQMAPSSGEACLIARQGAVPNITAATNTLALSAGGGHKFQKPGSENALFGPAAGPSAMVPAGNYYVAVISEGQTPQSAGQGTNGASSVDFALSSVLPAAIVDLGPAGNGDLLRADSLQNGETAAYTFSLPPGALGLTVGLENVTGSPFLRMRNDQYAALDPSAYGQDGGYKGTWESANRVSLSSPAPGIYTVTVRAAGSGNSWPGLQYTLRVHADLSLKSLSFDGGSATVSGQLDLWQVFQVTVPSSALGWDLRLLNVTSGAPRMVICRDLPPVNLNNRPELYRMTNWPSGWQLAPDVDWTGLADADGRSSTGRVFQAGLGNPLEPGTYYIGVTNLNSTNAASYTISSRGIGTGFLIPVTDMAFPIDVLGGTLSPRETAWYRITVPSGVPDWKVDLNFDSGDGLLVVQRGWLPSIGALGNNALVAATGGKKMQKPGDEHLLYLSVAAGTNLPAGTYYLGVISEGSSTTNSPGRLGTSNSSFTILSEGAVPPLDLGTVGVKDLLVQAALQGGECGTYRFTVPAGILAAEASFEQTNGFPVMTLAPGSAPPAAPLVYGADGGAPIQVQSTNVITLPNPSPTNFSITVQAAPSGPYFSNAAFNLRIRSLPIFDLNFDSQLDTNGLSNFDVAVLPDGHKAFYRIQVPQILAGQPVVGWMLNLGTLYGTAQMRVRKDALPDASVGTSSYFGRQAVFVPDYLTPGTWYVEVKASGLTDYTLTSQALRLFRPAWQMPTAGDSVITPGLPVGGPFFGDTGVDTNGVALPNDQGTDLEADSLHYYAVIVPPGNAGLLRTEVDAISGNANLYLRESAPPTLSYNASGAGGALYDRALTNSVGTQYGNWVPLDGKSEFSLAPGTWFLAVHAAWGSNIRYRLRLSTGSIANLPFDGGSLSGQSLAGGDWRYFRVAVPASMPYQWLINLGEQQGDVSLYLRDTVPPGQGSFDADFVDWSRDDKNHGPYLSNAGGGSYVLSVPPVRPGTTYYLGVRASRDATVSISSTPGTNEISLDGILSFKDGYVTNQIPAGGIQRYRIDVPTDARRWSHGAVHDAKVRLYLDQGSLPTLTTVDHWYSVGANTTNNKALYSSSWPWLSGYMYFLTVTNTATNTQSFSFRMDGRDCSSDDFNSDGIPDCWEIAYFGSIYTYGPNSDPDGDGLNNLQEYTLGTDPTVPNSKVIGLAAPAVRADGTFTCSCIGTLNFRYRLQGSPNLLPGSWTDLTNFVQVVPVQSITVPAGTGQASRFYRMVSP